MAVQINWALARTPDFSQNALQGFQQGQAMGKQQATQNALRQYQTDPQGSINALTSIDPAQASALRQSYVQDQSMQRQQVFRDSLSKGDMAGATKAAAGDPALMQSLDQYRGHMKSLNDQQAAGLQAVAGIADPTERARVWDQTVAPKLVQLGQDPNAVSSKSLDLTDAGIKAAVQQTMTAKDQIDLGFKATDRADKQAAQAETGRHNLATEGQQAETLKETGRHNKVDEAAGATRAKAAMMQAQSAGWQAMLDKDGTPYRLNARTGQATTLDGSQPYAPSGIVKPGSNTPRSAPAMAVQKFMQENPNATAEDVAQFGSHLRAQAKATADFATGAQGKTLNSLNVAVDHLGTMQEAADALHNGNIQLFNKVAKEIQTQTGGAAPTNFDTTKQIVSGEVVKAITGAGGGVADREHAATLLNKANSPAQLSGAIKQIKKLMAGQINGLRTQYKATTGLDDFETRLNPTTRTELEALGGAAPATGAKPSLADIFGKQ